MSYTRVDEKDTVIFYTKDDYEKLPTDQEALPLEPGSASAGSPNEAYNPETNEINWDCPCIAPMIKPPCGDTFKAAFSCFVYSTAEPKGFDCIDQFKEMQKCFREHPDIYGEELDAEDVEDADVAAQDLEK
ncbi:hypothetical protein SeMB42_g00645 [Synchytrium endobioticum]|uniref:Mitochondrial intermembrane space import and assembly protein 40 n=1 Tax=Synchytrium endobioticum TaxID=286115 RepID=A0A507D2K8_9FUNG|nr:hypothetical protein SeLEV6574_g03786 [Synchytrium endobioticum]TPX53650.1 hypothetical protein SeMB42_g00645 [Synchytrium endobioticum]